MKKLAKLSKDELASKLRAAKERAQSYYPGLDGLYDNIRYNALLAESKRRALDVCPCVP